MIFASCRCYAEWEKAIYGRSSNILDKLKAHAIYASLFFTSKQTYHFIAVIRSTLYKTSLVWLCPYCRNARITCGRTLQPTNKFVLIPLLVSRALFCIQSRDRMLYVILFPIYYEVVSSREYIRCLYFYIPDVRPNTNWENCPLTSFCLIAKPK